MHSTATRRFNWQNNYGPSEWWLLLDPVVQARQRRSLPFVACVAFPHKAFCFPQKASKRKPLASLDFRLTVPRNPATRARSVRRVGIAPKVRILPNVLSDH